MYFVVDTVSFFPPLDFLRSLTTQGDGMTANQKAICDGFVYIRQYGPGTASLNVAVAASIVMHHFGLWARYEVRGRENSRLLTTIETPPKAHRGRMHCIACRAYDYVHHLSVTATPVRQASHSVVYLVTGCTVLSRLSRALRVFCGTLRLGAREGG